MNIENRSLRTLLRSNRGANMVEYIILVGLVAVVALVVFQNFGNTVKDKVKGQTQQVNTTVTNQPGS